MQIQKTKDGSDSLVSKEFGELYHSHHGSMQEANHIFIQNGIAQIYQTEITIFEMGFGSGLNAILSYYFAQKHQLKLNYVAIEAYPVALDIVKELNYNQFINEADYNEVFLEMHQCQWNESVPISDSFTLHKIKNFIEKVDFDSHLKSKVDIIYYDAFAPTAQENLWQEPVLQKMYSILKPQGFLITYCAKGSFKRCLKKIGFQIQALDGPIGKREITKAIKS